MAEFSIIDRFCTNLGAPNSLTDIAVGDDAAVINIPTGKRLVISVDTMVSGVHFYADASPCVIAHKLLAVNLSDIAAMGAEPKWATMTLTAPVLDIDWIREFSNTIDIMAKQYGVQLIGGDTTQGELNLSMQIMGLVSKSEVLTRDAAKVGDDVYVSNTIGDAALALQCIESQTGAGADASFNGVLNSDLLRALEQPTPQTQLGCALLSVANACIDISDGLVADLSHVARKSNVNLELDVERIPLSDHYLYYLKQGGAMDIALTGGDDYQLAFTAPRAHRALMKTLSNNLKVSITRIGAVKSQVNNGPQVALYLAGEPYELAHNSGYQHFQKG